MFGLAPRCMLSGLRQSTRPTHPLKIKGYKIYDRNVSAHRCISTQSKAVTVSASTAADEGGRPRLILGIESSCDDSCASVVTSDRRILSSIVTRQDHSSTSGIHPLYAAIGHQSGVPSSISRALDVAGVTMDQIDAIAVTQGPGMTACLAVGMGAAKTLSAVHQIPLIYVHHMVAHALTPLLTEEQPPSFPFLTLLVSGGHTLLVLVENVERFKILATTNDDSIGDAFDKVARDLGIPWTSAPGAALEHLASQHNTTNTNGSVDKNAPTFPIPCKGQPAFSFSGLKSAVQRYIQEQAQAHSQLEQPEKSSTSPAPSLPKSVQSSIAHSFQVAASAQLEDKLKMVLRPTFTTSSAPAGNGSSKKGKSYPRIEVGVDPASIKSVVVSGGVASNRFLRSRLRICLDEIDRSEVELHFPPLNLCTDNAAMIAWVGHLMFRRRTLDLTPQPKPKWSVEQYP